MRTMRDDLNDLNATLTNPYGALFADENDIKNPYRDTEPEMTMDDLDQFVKEYNSNGHPNTDISILGD